MQFPAKIVNSEKRRTLFMVRRIKGWVIVMFLDFDTRWQHLCKNQKIVLILAKITFIWSLIEKTFHST